MSLQTKKQSLGYLLKGLYDMDMPKSKISEAISKFDSLGIPEENYNEDTLSHARALAMFIDIDISDFKSSVYWAFDDTTVEEAEFFYHFFTRGKRGLMNRYNFSIYE